MKHLTTTFLVFSTSVYANDELLLKNNYGHLESDYQNMQVLVESFNGSYALKLYSESISKNEVTFTFDNKFKKVDCIYHYYYSYKTHFPIGLAKCSLNIDMNQELLDSYQKLFENISIKEDANIL